MQALLQDPQTIPFHQGTSVNLRLLKKEITRRIVKIKAMLGQPSVLPLRHPKLSSMECQTQNLNINSSLQPSSNVSKVLTPQMSVARLPFTKDQKAKYTGRCSLPVGSNRRKNKESFDAVEGPIKKIRVSEYLTTTKHRQDASNKKKMCALPDQSEGSNQKKFIQSSQDDKIFNSKQFDQLSSYRASQHFLDRHNAALNLPLIFASPNHELTEFDSEDSDVRHKRSNSIGKLAPSLKKIRFTERTAPEYERRIVVGDECLGRMMEEVQKLVGIKRREAQDNKLRENIFRKIDQKYGQYYHNI